MWQDCEAFRKAKAFCVKGFFYPFKEDVLLQIFVSITVLKSTLSLMSEALFSLYAFRVVWGINARILMKRLQC